MNVKLSRKGKMASLLLISILIISVVSLTLVLGEKPEDPGLPPTGLLAEMLERIEILEADLTNLQNELSSIHSDIGSLGEWAEWQVADIRDSIAFIDNDIRSDIALVNEVINNVNDGLQNQIDWINEVTANLQNQIDQLRSEDLMEIWNHLDNVIPMLSQGIAGIWDDIDTNIHPRIDSLQAQINDINSGTVHLQSEVNSLQGQILDIRGDIQILYDSVGSLQTQINEMNAVVWDNRDRINGLQGQINSHEEDINRLQNQVDDLYRRMPNSITVPAASFVPVDDKQGTVNHGGYLRNQDGTYTAQAHAGVQLPDGATITCVYFYWYSSRVDDEWPISLVLGKYVAGAYPDGYIPLITLHSGTGGLGSTVGYLSETVGRYYPHYLTVNIPPWSYGDYRFFYAIIFYEYFT